MMPQEFRELIESDLKKCGEVIRVAKIRPE
jgi:hypothetical protein